MASKSKARTLALVGKLSSAQAEREISKLKNENAYLKKTLEELASQKGEPSDSENNRLLLERILALETLREKNSQQILTRDQEIASLRQQLRPGSAEVVANLQAQLNQQRLDAEMREQLVKSLKQQTEELKNKLAAISAKLPDMENRDCPLKSGTADGQTATSNLAVIQEHLKDALEKNQQWLAYDQQRETYVKAVLARECHLKQQLKKIAETKEALQEKYKETISEVRQAVEKQQHFEDLLHSAQAELKVEQERVAQGGRQLSQLQQRCEDLQHQVTEMRQQLQTERLDGKKELRRSGHRSERLCAELDSVCARLEEEKLRSAELLQQVNVLQKSLLNQRKEQNQISILEQQIQISAKDLEEEKCEKLHLQLQLHKVLKELRKAKDQVTRLESEVRKGLAYRIRHVKHEMTTPVHCEPQKTQREAPSSEPSAYTKLDKASRESQQSFGSPTRAHSLLDESFLECPNCRAQYPTSHHRELLVHIDQCLD